MQREDEASDNLLLTLLTDYHGRYAAAQAAAAAEPAAQREAARLRDLLARAQHLDALHPAARPEGFDVERKALRGQVAACRAGLLATLRRGVIGTVSSGVTLASLRQSQSTALHALLLLVQHSPPSEPGDAATALVLAPGAASFARVKLPAAVMHMAQAWMPVADVAGPRRAAGVRGDGEDLPDAEDLRAAVQSAWQRIAPLLGDATEVFVALHGELGHLPWQAAEDEHVGGRWVGVFPGVGAAALALREGPLARVAPPGPGRPLHVLSHTPLPDEAASWPPIPAVHVDLALTECFCSGPVQTSSRAEVLAAAPRLLQLSCHGTPLAAHTGPGATMTQAGEIAAALARVGERADMVALLACCTGRAWSNPWGEAGGWAVALQGHARVVLGSLYPVDDAYAPLFTALLHRTWAETGDLRMALRETRQRLRSGCWADDEVQAEALRAAWRRAIETTWPPGAHHSRAAMLDHVDRCFAVLHGRPYGHLGRDAGDHRLRLLAEGMVMFG